MYHVQENKCTQPGYNSYISFRRVYCFLCIINIRLRCIAYAPFFCLLCSFLVVFMETFRNNIRVRHIVTWNVLNHSMLITQCSLSDFLYRQMLVLLKIVSVEIQTYDLSSLLSPFTLKSFFPIH